jgi:hypothetical protein
MFRRNELPLFEVGGGFNNISIKRQARGRRREDTNELIEKYFENHMEFIFV